ncbi:DHH family phosphoesterase [Desulfonauticus submarinus]|uniref:DHH family protein n=1 Tax=Desulfonauticus submarinus TaxID=206665 RepID=A0A1H0ELY6_9BACT|nr:DHH family phosphoesterase [Desulfonauticus submarinus]SDN83438.1 DHH family protein [Desulfonauticus submarinus]
MAYFKNLTDKIPQLLNLLDKQERWLILINADPDALSSALALKRIMARRVLDVGIGHINEISRPDNLAMIRLLRIPTKKVTSNLIVQYDRFALVDSQPHHHPSFQEIDFSIVIDHHPLSSEHPVEADFQDIRPDYGANATILTEYLYNLKIRPGKLLATALVYGIKTDTQSFERPFAETDIKAFKYLTKFYNSLLLQKIIRSEFHKDWLKYFCQAFRKLKFLGNGLGVCLGNVESPDILVILADFFLQIHNISWDMVGGVYDNKLVVIFRGDGLRRDMGKLAMKMFSDYGPAGGHRAMARAEVPLENLNGVHPQQFLWQRFYHVRKKSRKVKSGKEGQKENA